MSSPTEIQCWRVKRFVFSLEFFALIMRENLKYSVTEGIPQGAKVVRALIDTETGCLTLFMEHESFPPIPEGTTVPTGVIGFSTPERIPDASEIPKTADTANP